MSYAGKIMSDIIQTTSDLFWAVVTFRNPITYMGCQILDKVLGISGLVEFAKFAPAGLFCVVRKAGVTVVL